MEKVIMVVITEETDDFCIYADENVVSIYSKWQDRGYYFPAEDIHNCFTGSELVDFLKITFPLIMEIGNRLVDESDSDDDKTYYCNFRSEDVSCLYSDSICYHFKCSENHGLNERKEYDNRVYCDILNTIYTAPYIIDLFINYIPIYFHSNDIDSLFELYNKVLEERSSL